MAGYLLNNAYVSIVFLNLLNKSTNIICDNISISKKVLSCVCVFCESLMKNNIYIYIYYINYIYYIYILYILYMYSTYMYDLYICMICIYV